MRKVKVTFLKSYTRLSLVVPKPSTNEAAVKHAQTIQWDSNGYKVNSDTILNGSKNTIDKKQVKDQ